MTRRPHLTFSWAWRWSGVRGLGSEVCRASVAGLVGGCTGRCGWRRFLRQEPRPSVSCWRSAAAAGVSLLVLEAAATPRALPLAPTHGCHHSKSSQPHRRHELVIFVLSYCLGGMFTGGGSVAAPTRVRGRPSTTPPSIYIKSHFPHPPARTRRKIMH